MTSTKKIVVGLSGGVDSSVSLLLLKKQGWQPVGVTLRLPVWGGRGDNLCCNPKSLDTAQKVCRRLNIPYYIHDARTSFQKEVVNYFVSQIKALKTPNPCVVCNRRLKFLQLFEIAKKLGADYIATGHYARIKVKSKKSKVKNYELLMGKDKSKDQSYYLSFLPQKWLSKIVFPIGEYTKAQVYKIADKSGLNYWQKSEQSQDFCYLGKSSLTEFIDKEIGQQKGSIIDSKGNVLGKHRGLYFYTLGQRQGIKLAGGPFYVKGFDISKNQLVVTNDKKDIYKKELILTHVNFISDIDLSKNPKVKAKIRYRNKLSSATLYPQSDTNLKIVFDQAQLAPTPGQFCAFYLNQVCLGSGVIN